MMPTHTFERLCAKLKLGHELGGSTNPPSRRFIVDISTANTTLSLSGNCRLGCSGTVELLSCCGCNHFNCNCVYLGATQEARRGRQGMQACQAATPMQPSWQLVAAHARTVHCSRLLAPGMHRQLQQDSKVRIYREGR